MKNPLQRVWEHASIYLPVLLMAVLAMGTWWLVRHAPKPQQVQTEAVLTDDPDYVLERFSVHQFDGDGRLSSVMLGEQARHLPKSDILEVDEIRTRSFTQDGVVTEASAKRGLSNSDSSEVQLVGNAEVTRTSPQQLFPPLRITGEVLQAWPNEELLQSYLPVVLSRGNDRFTGDSLRYDNISQTTELNGRVKGVMYPKTNRF